MRKLRPHKDATSFWKGTKKGRTKKKDEGTKIVKRKAGGRRGKGRKGEGRKKDEIKTINQRLFPHPHKPLFVFKLS